MYLKSKVCICVEMYKAFRLNNILMECLLKLPFRSASKLYSNSIYTSMCQFSSIRSIKHLPQICHKAQKTTTKSLMNKITPLYLFTV